MEFGKLFSFDGRVGRKEIWGIGIANVIVQAVAWGVVASELTAVLKLPFIVVLVAGLMVGLATQVKRWHDRDKSGWWFLITLVPFIGGIWAFVELGCLSGTPGNNQYGSPNSGAPFEGEPSYVDAAAIPSQGGYWDR